MKDERERLLSLRWTGSEFQFEGPAYANERPPYEASFTRGKSRWPRQRWNRVSGSRVSGSPGQQFGSGSGRVTGQSPDPVFWPGFLFNVVKNCRQSISCVIMGINMLATKQASISMLLSISLSKTAQSQCTVHACPLHTYANTHSTDKWATFDRKAMRRMRRCDALSCTVIHQAYPPTGLY